MRRLVRHNDYLLAFKVVKLCFTSRPVPRRENRHSERGKSSASNPIFLISVALEVFGTHILIFLYPSLEAGHGTALARIKKAIMGLRTAPLFFALCRICRNELRSRLSDWLSDE
jgi:hypothetical protein